MNKYKRVRITLYPEYFDFLPHYMSENGNVFGIESTQGSLSRSNSIVCIHPIGDTQGIRWFIRQSDIKSITKPKINLSKYLIKNGG
jgi:hypothetical protein